MKLTVIVTAYNEVRTILQAIKDVEKITVPDKEVIIFDNCSTDGTRELLKELKDERYQIVFNERNLNAGSFINGMRMAKGEYIYTHHTDLEYDPSDAVKMLAVAEEGGFDAVFGSRLKNYKSSIWGKISERPAYLASILSTALINRWYGKNFTDIIGSKLYRTSSIRKIPIGTWGFSFDFENISRMFKRGFKVAEVAVSYNPRSSKEGKKIKPYHIISALFFLFKVRYFE